MLQKVIYLVRSTIINVNKVKRKYGGNRISIFIDMIFSLIRYSATPANYYYFGFARLKHAQRNTYVTHKLSEQIQKNITHLSIISFFMIS